VDGGVSECPAVIPGRATALAVVVLRIGYDYDLRVQGTAWEMGVPFALGIPLCRSFGWLGATGGLCRQFAILVPTAVLDRAGMAIAMRLGLFDRDATAGVCRFGGRGSAWGPAAIQAILPSGSPGAESSSSSWPAPTANADRS